MPKIIPVSARGALLSAVILATPAAAFAQTLQYPETKKEGVVEDYHGTRVADPYRWLEDQNGAATAQWVQAQNAVTFPYLARLPERERIETRLTKLWNFPRYGTPFREGELYFFTKNSGLQNQSVLFVQKSLRDSARVLLDPNLLSADGTVALTSVAITDDGRLMGYGTATSGSDWNEFHVRDVATGTDLPDAIKWSKFSGMSWTKDGRGFFYSRYPEPKEGEQLSGALLNRALYYHVLGTAQADDRLIHAIPEHPTWGTGGFVSEDGRYLFISISETTDPKNRLYYVDLKDPAKPDLSGPVVKLFDDFDALRSVIDNDGPIVYIRTNDGAPLGKLIAVDTRDPSQIWTVLPEAQQVLQSATVLGGRIFAHYLKDAKSVVEVYAHDGKSLGEMSLPGIGALGSLSGKKDSNEAFYSFASFLYPNTIFRYDVATGKSEVFAAPEIDFNAGNYETKQVFYTSKDGTRVPMFITHRKGIALDRTNPTYLYGYGGFNVSMTPFFSVPNLVWLELGGVFAMPNLRGGGEYGREWHQAGTRERKQNVFDDFIAAAEYLIEQGYTSKEKLAIGGGSNGGLLVGAAITQRPDLFAVAFPDVGVLDMLRYHKFTIGRAWSPDYGLAEDPEGFKYLYAYSPLHNVKPGTCYPATLISTADHDDRVIPGHSFKFAATLQPAQGCDRPVLIRIETKAGHGAGTPISKTIEQVADKWAFARRHMGK